MLGFIVEVLFSLALYRRRPKPMVVLVATAVLLAMAAVAIVRDSI